jgi:hypothetical protein
VPERIHRYRPDVKLILALRNPIDRAWSHHLHEIRKDRLPKELYEFSKALEKNPSYVEQGKYGSALERYLEYFDPCQIHIVWFEDVVAKPNLVLQQLFRFLEVDDSFSPKIISEKSNSAHIQKSRTVYHGMRSMSRSIQTVFGPQTVKIIKSTGATALVRNLNRKQFGDDVVPPLRREDRECLRHEFAEENDWLSALTGRDLSLWI